MLKIKNIAVADLIPYENNPRKNDAAVEYVANSIREFGFKVPVIVDQDNVIVAGHTRVKAAELLGLKEVPAIVADDLSAEQVRAFRLADNKVTEAASWDKTRLDLEMDGIAMDMEQFGFIVAPYNGEEYEDFFEETVAKEPEKKERPTVVCPYCGETVEL